MNIIRLSEFASEILKAGMRGTVHSVYRRTVNLSLNGQLLALQAENSPLSPISLLTDAAAPELASPRITAGAPVFTDETSVLIGYEDGIAIPVISSDREDLFLSCKNILTASPDPACGTAELSDRIRSVLREGESDGFSGIFQDSPDISGDLIRTAAAARLASASEAIYGGDPVSAADSLASLIGVGTGLTPSGDDFLCGLLAGLRLSGTDPLSGGGLGASEAAAPGLSAALHDAVQSRAGRTNDISRAFLTCALKGQFSEAVVRLASLPDTETITGLFDAIGHSSGRDTLCGILFALSGRCSV